MNYELTNCIGCCGCKDLFFDFINLQFYINAALHILKSPNYQITKPSDQIKYEGF